MSKRRVFVGDPGQLNPRIDVISVRTKGGNFTLYESKVTSKAVRHLTPAQWERLEQVLGGEILKRSGLSDEPDDAPRSTMPEIGQKLLPFIVPKKLRANVEGDLAEDFRTYATQWGRSYALRWLWWELGGLCIRRFGPTAIITAIGVWLRQKLGL
jgi:hypothetical protein